MHGYAVARQIRERSREVILVEEGALYPALHRLERRAWIQAEWGLSENNRRAKFYELTAAGRGELRRERAAGERETGAGGGGPPPAGRPHPPGGAGSGAPP